MTGVARGALTFGTALALFGLTLGTSFAEQTTGEVYGRVYTDNSHRPAGGVTVLLLSDREPMQETRTRPDGSFTFLAVFPGDVTVKVGELTTPVDVHANLESDSTILLGGESFTR
jgi:hypothetical protein